jgi:hypothetical protein
MPSVHVGWAILAAILVIETARGQWRWLALAYPPLTVFVVAVTANHFWLDGIVAAVLLAAVLLVQRAFTGRRRHASPPESGPVSRRWTWDHPGEIRPRSPGSRPTSPPATFNAEVSGVSPFTAETSGGQRTAKSP